MSRRRPVHALVQAVRAAGGSVETVRGRVRVTLPGVPPDDRPLLQWVLRQFVTPAARPHEAAAAGAFHMTPDLAALLGNGADLAALDTPRLLALLEEVDAAAEALAVVRRRLHAQVQRRLEAQPTHDVYLTLAEAAARLHVTEDWLRRRPHLPFVAKLSDGVVRYSAKRLDAYMAAACRNSLA